jgi:DnaA family protein
VGPKGLAKQASGNLTVRQLTLPLGPGAHATFANFVAGENVELVERLKAPPVGFAALAIHGPRGCGRSHLLQATCRQHAAQPVAYVPLASARDPDRLAGLERRVLVALDDVDAWLGEAELEQALMGLYQALVANGAQLVLSASAAPAALDCRYADLASRLRAAETHRLRELDDRGKARVLAERARTRGIEVPRTVLDYWMSHSRRGLGELLADLEVLDTASLAEHRRVTVPLVKRVLGL